MRAALLVAFGLSLTGFAAEALRASDAPRFGVQAGLAVPSGRDLSVTTGSGTGLDLGLHATWELADRHVIRPRVDLWVFTQGHQVVQAPKAQRIDTKVQGLALGGDYLFRPTNKWAVGAGLYLIRWSVESSNQLSFPGAVKAQATGTSHWNRLGLGLMGTYRLAPRLEAEARCISSQYGYENLPARLCTAGLLWRF